MGANHADNIVINVALQQAPADTVSFNVAAHIADGITLGGDRVRTYTSPESVAAALAAGEISSAVAAAGVVAFSQVPRPGKWKVIRVTTSTPETYLAALNAARLLDDDWYGLTLDTRDDTIQMAVSAAVEAMDKHLVIQSSDADWATSGLPSDYAALAGRENTSVVFHDTNAQWADVGWIVSRLTFDPDTQSAAWNGAVRGVTGFATPPTDTQKGHLDNNKANHGLPFGSAAFWVDPGLNCAGRPIHEIVTAHWFKRRMSDRLIALQQAYSARGAKIPMSEIGQQIVLGEIEVLLVEAVAADHFAEGQTRATAQAITDTDRNLQRLRFRVEAQFEGSARLFTVDVNLTRTPFITGEAS